MNRFLTISLIVLVFFCSVPQVEAQDLTVQQILNNVLVGNALKGMLSEGEVLNLVYSSGDSALKIALTDWTALRDSIVAVLNDSAFDTIRVDYLFADDSTLYVRASDHRIGVNTKAPRTLFHLKVDAGDADATYSYGFNDLRPVVVESDTHMYIMLISPPDMEAMLSFSDTTANVGGIVYRHSSDLMGFYTGGIQRFYIRNDTIYVSTGVINAENSKVIAETIVGDVVRAKDSLAIGENTVYLSADKQDTLFIKGWNSMLQSRYVFVGTAADELESEVGFPKGELRTDILRALDYSRLEGGVHLDSIYTDAPDTQYNFANYHLFTGRIGNNLPDTAGQGALGASEHTKVIVDGTLNADTVYIADTVYVGGPAVFDSTAIFNADVSVGTGIDRANLYINPPNNGGTDFLFESVNDYRALNMGNRIVLVSGHLMSFDAVSNGYNFMINVPINYTFLDTSATIGNADTLTAEIAGIDNIPTLVMYSYDGESLVGEFYTYYDVQAPINRFETFYIQYKTSTADSTQNSVRIWWGTRGYDGDGAPTYNYIWYDSTNYRYGTSWTEAISGYGNGVNGFEGTYIGAFSAMSQAHNTFVIRMRVVSDDINHKVYIRKPKIMLAY